MVQVFRVRSNFPDGFDQLARVVIAFGRIEYLIKLSIKSLMGQGIDPGMFHAESESRRGFAKLCDEAKRQAASKLTASPQASFDQIIDRVKDLANYRNDTVHALWTTDTNGHPLRIRPSLNKATKSVDWDQSRIVDVAELRQKRLEMER